MALLQVQSEGSDKWGALNRVIKKESTWIENTTVAARLEHHINEHRNKKRMPRQSLRESTSPTPSRHQANEEAVSNPRVPPPPPPLFLPGTVQTPMEESKAVALLQELRSARQQLHT